MILPNVESLTMTDVTIFTRENNVVPDFKEKWGEGYFANALSFWSDFRKNYHEDQPHTLSLNELLFLLYYDFAIGGHAKDKGNPLPFYKWVFEQIT